MPKNLQNIQKETPPPPGRDPQETCVLSLIKPLYPLNIPHNHEPTLLRQVQKLTRVCQHAPLGPPPLKHCFWDTACLNPPFHSGDTLSH